jgi:hypothetical protein
MLDTDNEMVVAGTDKRQNAPELWLTLKVRSVDTNNNNVPDVEKYIMENYMKLTNLNVKHS